MVPDGDELRADSEMGWWWQVPRAVAQQAAGFAAQLELRPPRAIKDREIPVCGAGTGDLQRRGAAGP